MMVIMRWIRRIAAIGLAIVAVFLFAASIFQSEGEETHISVVIIAWILVGTALVAAWVVWPKRRPIPANTDAAASTGQIGKVMEVGGVTVDAAALVSLTNELAIVIDDGVIDKKEQDDIDALVSELGLIKKEQDAVLAAIIGGMIEDAMADGEVDEEEETWIRAALVALRIELNGPLSDLFQISRITRSDAADLAKQLQQERRTRGKPRRESHTPSTIPNKDNSPVEVKYRDKADTEKPIRQESTTENPTPGLSIIPNEEHASIEFIYRNSKDEIKNKSVDVVKIRTDKSGSIELRGFDQVAGGYRSFKLARMRDIVDASTGEIYDTPATWALTAAQAAKAPADLLSAIK